MEQTNNSEIEKGPFWTAWHSKL